MFSPYPGIRDSSFTCRITRYGDFGRRVVFADIPVTQETEIYPMQTDPYRERSEDDRTVGKYVGLVRKYRLTGEYGGVRDPSGNFDRQSVMGDVKGVVSVSEHTDAVAITTFRVRVLQYQLVVVHQFVALSTRHG